MNTPNKEQKCEKCITDWDIKNCPCDCHKGCIPPNKEASVEETVQKLRKSMNFAKLSSCAPQTAENFMDKIEQALQTQEARVREEERNRIKNECHYCQGMGTVRESVEQDNGTGAIEQFDCSLCKGKGFITPTINKDNKSV